MSGANNKVKSEGRWSLFAREGGENHKSHAKGEIASMWERLTEFGDTVLRLGAADSSETLPPSDETGPSQGHESNEFSGEVRTTITNCLMAHGIRTLDVRVRRTVPEGLYKLHVTVGSDVTLAQLLGIEPILGKAILKMHQMEITQVWWRLHPVVGRN